MVVFDSEGTLVGKVEGKDLIRLIDYNRTNPIIVLRLETIIEMPNSKVTYVDAQGKNKYVSMETIVRDGIYTGRDYIYEAS